MSKLFETTTIKSMTITNRFVRSATWMGMADREGACTPELIDHMVGLARENVGLIISGFAYVTRQGMLVPQQLGIHNDGLIPGLRAMTDAVHNAGGKIVVQIMHGGLSSNSERTGSEVVGPSVLTAGKDPAGRAMSREEIKETVGAFRTAAVRAQKAGFDGIQIHAAHGFLLSQFLSPFFNKRDDDYGGSIGNRSRILLEIVRSVREAVGDGFPILVKINSDDLLDGGFFVDEMLQVSKLLEKSGVDAVELCGGTILGLIVNNPDIFFSPMGKQGVYYEEAAKLFKKEISIPLMLVGGIRSFEESQRLVEEGTADYVSLCRPLIREPDLVRRWETGDTGEADCISCNGCFKPGLEGRGVYCIHAQGYRRKKGLLRFYAATSGAVNTRRAVAECLEKALGERNLDCDLIIFYTTMGHSFEDILSEAHHLCPNALITGTTCAGVIGREGPNESMRALGIMAVNGPGEGFAVACTESMVNVSSYDAGVQIARDLKSQNEHINMILYHPSGVDVMPAEKMIAGIESVFGPDVPIFGGASIDNMKLVSNFQFLGNRILERGAVAVGFSDPTLELISKANHGFSVFGKPFTVTRSESSRIYELDGKPAWNSLTERVGLSELAHPFELWAFTQLAVELPGELHEEYGSKYIIRAGGGLKEPDGSIHTGVSSPEGTKLWLVKRDEKGLIDGIDRMTEQIVQRCGGRRPVAVFQADCVLRGRSFFNRVLKDETVNRTQYPLCKDENVPWLGMYGGGELTPLGGRNQIHYFTTSLYVIVER